MKHARHKHHPQKHAASASNAERAERVDAYAPGNTYSHFETASLLFDVPQSCDPEWASNSVPLTKGPLSLKPHPSLVALARILGRQAAREAFKKGTII
jgi:hypothetical protein